MLEAVEMLNKAYQIVTEACGDNLDRSGVLEVLHPLGVAGRLIGHPATTQTVALLHDLLEDYPDLWSADKLLDMGFPPEVVRAVEAITRREEEPYLGEYIPRAKQNPISNMVKREDINYNFNRLDRGIPAADAASLRERWVKAIRILQG